MYNCHFACLSAIVSVLKLSLHCFLVVTSCIVYCQRGWISCDVYLHKFTFLFFRTQSFQDKVSRFSFSSMLTNVWWLSVHILYFYREAECLMIFYWHNFSFLFFRRMPLQDKVRCGFESRSGHMWDAKFCTGRSGGFSPGTPVFPHLWSTIGSI